MVFVITCTYITYTCYLFCTSGICSQVITKNILSPLTQLDILSHRYNYYQHQHHEPPGTQPPHPQHSRAPARSAALSHAARPEIPRAGSRAECRRPPGSVSAVPAPGTALSICPSASCTASDFWCGACAVRPENGAHTGGVAAACRSRSELKETRRFYKWCVHQVGQLERHLCAAKLNAGHVVIGKKYALQFAAIGGGHNAGQLQIGGHRANERVQRRMGRCVGQPEVDGTLGLCVLSGDGNGRAESLVKIEYLVYLIYRRIIYRWILCMHFR